MDHVDANSEEMRGIEGDRDVLVIYDLAIGCFRGISSEVQKGWRSITGADTLCRRGPDQVDVHGPRSDVDRGCS